MASNTTSSEPLYWLIFQKPINAIRSLVFGFRLLFEWISAVAASFIVIIACVGIVLGLVSLISEKLSRNDPWWDMELEDDPEESVIEMEDLEHKEDDDEGQP